MDIARLPWAQEKRVWKPTWPLLEQKREADKGREAWAGYRFIVLSGRVGFRRSGCVMRDLRKTSTTCRGERRRELIVSVTDTIFVVVVFVYLGDGRFVDD